MSEVFLKTWGDGKLPQYLGIHEFFHSTETTPFVWQIEWLKNMWERSVKTTHPLHRRFKVKEALILQEESFSSGHNHSYYLYFL